MSSLPHTTGMLSSDDELHQGGAAEAVAIRKLDRIGKAAQVVDAIEDIRILNEGGLAFYGFGVHLC